MEPLAIRSAILVASPTAFESERTVYTPPLTRLPSLTRLLLHANSYTRTLTRLLLHASCLGNRLRIRWESIHAYTYTPTLTRLLSLPWHQQQPLRQQQPPFPQQQQQLFREL